VPSDQCVNPAPFRLKDLRVDPAAGLVAGPGGSVRLEPRVMAVLEMLARHPGQLVTRTELLAAIWPGGGVYDEALTQCVYQLRQQLTSIGGSDDYRSLIATLPKRGYQLDCEVLPVEPPDETTVPSTVPGRRRHLLRWALLSMLLVSAAWIAFDRRQEQPAHQTPAGAGAIAVLPFLPLLEAQSDPVLEIGMADTLITRLSQVRNLVVRPVNAIQRYGGQSRDPLQAGQELGVEAIVDGNIQHLGDTIRVTVRLLRVSDGSALWASSFDEPYADIFALQDAICDRIAAALSVELLPAVDKRSRQGGTVNTRAYEQYLKGRFHLSRLTRTEMLTSAAYFREAVSLDPQYAEAWLGLANVLFRLPVAGEMPPLDFYPEAKAAALRALEIDDSLAEGYAILGWIAHWFEWDWTTSETLFKRAIQMNPNNAESHLGYAHLLVTTGRREQALVEVRRAREIDPMYQLAAALEGGFLVGAGRIDEALHNMEAAIRVDERFWLSHITLAAVYRALGRNADALAEFHRARELSADGTYALACEIVALAMNERDDDARRLMDELLEIASQRYVPPYHLALGYIGIGDADTSMEWLQKGLQGRDPKLALLANDPRFRSLRDRPEFQQLLRRLDLAGDA